MQKNVKIHIFFFSLYLSQNSYLNFSHFHKIICYGMSWVSEKGKSITTSGRWVHMTPWDKISPSYLLYSSMEKSANLVKFTGYKCTRSSLMGNIYTYINFMLLRNSEIFLLLKKLFYYFV